MRYLIRVRLALAAFLSFRPATELGVAPGGSGLGSGRLLTTETANQLADVNFVSTVRTFHRPQSTALNAYESCTKSN